MLTLRLFISSPGDVGRERELARKVIARVEGHFGRPGLRSFPLSKCDTPRYR